MLGHADTRTTMIYLGFTLDYAKVQEKKDDYLDLIRMKMRANPQAFQEKHNADVVRNVRAFPNTIGENE